jgi:hypothetical protein
MPLDGRKVELFCRDQLRDARASVLRDAEAFPEILFAVERLGSLTTGEQMTLGKYRTRLLEIASRSPLAEDVPKQSATYHSSASSLYDLVNRARNEALHQGVFARHLAIHAVELALLLEDALVNGARRVSDYMVKAPICAELWHPISHVRQQLLVNSFSYVPVALSGDDAIQWRLISDLALAKLLGDNNDRKERTKRLLATVDDAVTSYGLELVTPQFARPDSLVPDLLQESAGLPILVLDEADHLVGIATPFDFL